MDVGTIAALLLAGASALGTFFRSRRDTSLRTALAEEIKLETDLRKRCQERLTVLETQVSVLTDTVAGTTAVRALGEVVDTYHTEVIERLDKLARKR